MTNHMPPIPYSPFMTEEQYEASIRMDYKQAAIMAEMRTKEAAMWVERLEFDEGILDSLRERKRARENCGNSENDSHNGSSGS